MEPPSTANSAITGGPLTDERVEELHIQNEKLYAIWEEVNTYAPIKDLMSTRTITADILDGYDKPTLSSVRDSLSACLELVEPHLTAVDFSQDPLAVQFTGQGAAEWEEQRLWSKTFRFLMRGHLRKLDYYLAGKPILDLPRCTMRVAEPLTPEVYGSILFGFELVALRLWWFTQEHDARCRCKHPLWTHAYKEWTTEMNSRLANGRLIHGLVVSRNIARGVAEEHRWMITPGAAISMMRRGNMDWQAFVWLLKDVTLRALLFGIETWVTWRKRKGLEHVQARFLVKTLATPVAMAALAATERPCYICLQAYDLAENHEPGRLHCGHIFGRPCLAAWVAVVPKCPLCSAPLEPAPQPDDEMADSWLWEKGLPQPFRHLMIKWKDATERIQELQPNIDTHLLQGPEKYYDPEDFGGLLAKLSQIRATFHKMEAEVATTCEGLVQAEGKKRKTTRRRLRETWQPVIWQPGTSAVLPNT